MLLEQEVNSYDSFQRQTGTVLLLAIFSKCTPMLHKNFAVLYVSNISTIAVLCYLLFMPGTFAPQICAWVVSPLFFFSVFVQMANSQKGYPK
jgi:hypothetical protein